MSDTTDKPKLGHEHDLKPQGIVSFHMTMRKTTPSVGNVKEDKVEHLVSGLGELVFGVDGSEVTIGLQTKRTSSMDPNVVMEGAKLDINAAEHMIRALITLVKQAKKNQIDLPSAFGDTYSGLPLTSKE
jgi:hypothetical protein